MQRCSAAKRVTIIGNAFVSTFMRTSAYIYMCIYLYERLCWYLWACYRFNCIWFWLLRWQFARKLLNTSKLAEKKYEKWQAGIVAALLLSGKSQFMPVYVCVCRCCFKCSDNGPSSSLYSYIPINKCNANIWLSSTIVRCASSLGDWQRGSKAAAAALRCLDAGSNSA